MHKDFVINFAHLKLQRKIGVGSSATIFSGRLKQRCPVAVKVYAPYRLTEEVVAEFSHEAALCASLIHPNIVKFYGIFSPPFLHRDIKTANFLVDNKNNVKLTDFGDSRRLTGNVLKPENVDESQTFAESSDAFSPERITSAPPIKMTVKGTVNYMAPEMISCRTGLASYGASADVYSLAITFWDILYPGREKYAATNPLFVFEDVLNG
ncbi:unnamed protein product [Peronospora destructor]|uniref:Protein kinase domain-containing protein n=1 Tax=Peronospora destructor TaxID=86335 RepID=A0AAV0TSZ9_9STRA|nr:unnamed protein product [Peronospora destructor]